MNQKKCGSGLPPGGCSFRLRVVHSTSCVHKADDEKDACIAMESANRGDVGTRVLPAEHLDFSLCGAFRPV
eukprot:2901103-Alexandrium_andersonii.AAC.1